MKFIPRKIQEPMINAAVNMSRCALWASMGSGKTSAMLYAFQLLNLFKPLTALVVGPKRVIESTWPKQREQFDDFHDLRFSIIAGTAKQRTNAVNISADIYCISFNNLQWLYDAGKNLPIDIIIIDEATHVKSFRLRKGSKRAKALYKFCKERKILRLIELTGTPGSNGLLDLWGQVFFLDNGAHLGNTFSAFTSRWFEVIPLDSFTKYKPRPYAAEQITNAVKDFCISIRSEDYYELEKPIERDIVVELSNAHKTLYDKFESEMYTEIKDAEIFAVNSGVLTQKCLQFTSGAIYQEDKSYIEIHDEKIDALGSLISELNGESLIVAYHFRHEIDRIRKRFPDAVLFADDKSAERRWNKGEISILLLHPASAGHGLNLQYGGRNICFFTSWWAPEPRAQIIERIGPMRQMQAGLNRSVHVFNFVVSKTIDERVLMAHKYKMSVDAALKAGTVR